MREPIELGEWRFRSAPSHERLTSAPYKHIYTQRAPELYREPRPIVERQRPSPKARVARHGIILVDAAQDRVFEFGIGEFLRRAEELLSADTLAQGVAADERRPRDV